MSKPLLPPPRPTVTYANVEFSAPEGFRPLHMDLHLPAGAGPHPLVVWVHGGHWQVGSRVSMPVAIARCAMHERMLARGYAVADVDYRLARESPYPAQLVDVQAAIRWLRRNAAAVNVDPARIAAQGESAGGHLAAMAGLLGAGDTAVQAVVNWYGVTDLLTFSECDDADIIAVLLGGPAGDRLDFTRSASPTVRAHPGAPPFLTVHGTADREVPYRHGTDLTAALRRHGVRAELIPVPGADHCFEGYDDIGGLIEAGIDFLDDVLK